MSLTTLAELLDRLENILMDLAQTTSLRPRERLEAEGLDIIARLRRLK